jgi:hypothetical protein
MVTTVQGEGLTMRYFILNEDHSVASTDDVKEWAESFEKSQRVARTEVSPEVSVSTVFLGINHNYYGGPPLLFETMVFGGEHDQDIWRYASWEEAEAGHEEAVTLVKKGNDNE